MVVVVPAIAEGEDRDDDAVAGIVVAGVAAAADKVCKEVDGGGAVPDEDGADDDAPDEELGAIGAERGRGGREEFTEGVKGGAEKQRDDLVEAV